MNPTPTFTPPENLSDPKPPTIARQWITRAIKATKTLPKWVAVALPVVAVLGGLAGAGVAVALTPPVSTTGEYQALAAKTERAADLAADKIEVRDKTIDRLEDEVADWEKQEAALNLKEQALDTRDEELTARETAVGIAEQAKKANEFGPGKHLVGTDIQPGTYRSNGGSMCYWERLSGLGGGIYDIIANNIAAGPEVVEIGAGDVAFNSSGCGTWSKIG